MAIRRALGLILPLCVLSVLLSGLFISVVNDIYAFVKEDRLVTIDINEQNTLEQISDMLLDSGIIKNKEIFCAYVKSKNKQAAVEEFVGEITLNTSMSYREILLSLI